MAKLDEAKSFRKTIVINIRWRDGKASSDLSLQVCETC